MIPHLKYPFKISDPVYSPVVVVTGETYAEAILIDDPWLYWRLGVSGLTDLSGNARHGTGQGSLTVGGAAGLLTDDADTATAFNGSQDAYAADTPWANAAAFTFECWAIWDGTAWQGTFFGGYDPGQRPTLYAPGNDGSLQFILNLANDTLTWPAATIPEDTPFHLVFGFDEATNTARLVIDNVDKGAPSGSLAATYDSLGPFKIGAHGGGTGGWIGSDALDGTLDEVAVYDRLLTLDEIEHHFTRGTEGPSEGTETGGDLLIPARAATVDQGSPEEIAQNVYAAVASRIGERAEDPEYGTPSYLFRQGGVDEPELRRIVEELEPRASILTESEWEEMAETVRVMIR